MSCNARSTVLVTGAGFRAGPMRSPSAQKSAVKLNIGASTVFKLVREGEDVAFISRREETAEKLRAWLSDEGPGRVVAYSALDVTDSVALDRFIREIPADNGISLVQAVGLSSGNYFVEADNPYKLVTEVDADVIISETRIPVISLINSVRSLLPIWKEGVGAKVVVVNSMSGIRAYPRGASHATAKGALHQAVRSLSLELYTQRIYITEVNPGIVDTGLYDSPEVQDAVCDLARSFGQDIAAAELPSMSPDDVAETIFLALRSAAHVLQINMVATGQFPHLGA